MCNNIWGLKFIQKKNPTFLEKFNQNLRMKNGISFCKIYIFFSSKNSEKEVYKISFRLNLKLIHYIHTFLFSNNLTQNLIC